MKTSNRLQVIGIWPTDEAIRQTEQNQRGVRVREIHRNIKRMDAEYLTALWILAALLRGEQEREGRT